MSITATKPRKRTGAIVHVHPDNDDRAHRLHPDGKCWCGPKRTRLHGGLRVTHNASDEREFVEVQLGELLDDDKQWKITRIQ